MGRTAAVTHGGRQGTQICRKMSFGSCTTDKNAGLIKLNYITLIPLFNGWTPRVRGSCWNAGGWHNSKPSKSLAPNLLLCCRQAQPPTASSWHLPAHGRCLTHPWVHKTRAVIHTSNVFLRHVQQKPTSEGTGRHSNDGPPGSPVS